MRGDMAMGRSRIGDAARWARAHRAPVAVAAAVLAALLAASVARCTQVHAPTDQGAAQAETSEASAEDVADERLDASARALRSSYADDERQLVAMLSANCWTASQETVAASFDDRTWTETADGARTVTPYVVTACATTTRPADGNATATVTVFSVETPDGTYIAELQRVVGADGSASTTLSSEAFSRARAYSLSSAASALSVTGPDEARCSSMGTSRAALERALGDWCAQNYPTATKATWAETSTSDWAGGTVTLPYALDNAAKTRVVVTISQADGQIGVRKAG